MAWKAATEVKVKIVHPPLPPPSLPPAHLVEAGQQLHHGRAAHVVHRLPLLEEIVEVKLVAHLREQGSGIRV